MKDCGEGVSAEERVFITTVHSVFEKHALLSSLHNQLLTVGS